MIVNTGPEHVLSSEGLKDEKAFAIRTNTHAFKMLSSGLYSDKFAAVLREIGCNAVDSHIAAGIPQTPIEVKLPNAIDNQFYIKDFGIGLDHEDVMGLYTTYFASTKQQSNAMTGAFGLGSKSPFSYTDSFTVTSRHGGKARIYSAHIGAQGVPTIALMDERDIEPDDTWKTGIMIGFPVNKQDIAAFQDRAKRIYRFFTVAPTILGGDEIVPIKIAHDYKEFCFLNEGMPAHITVVMGGVAYPVNVNSLNIQPTDPFVSAIHGMDKILLRVPIGKVQVAGSREEIQYDEASRNYIIDTLKAAIKMVVTDLSSQASKCKTWVDRCTFAKTSHDTKGIRLSTALVKACNVPHADTIMKMYDTHSFQIAKPSYEPTYQFTICEHPNSGALGYKVKIGRTDPVQEWGNGNTIDFDPSIALVYGTEDRPLARVRQAMAAGVLKEKMLIVVGIRDKKTGRAKHVDDTVAKHRKEMPGIQEYKLSNYAPPPLRKSTKKKGKINDGLIPFNGKMTKVSDIPKEHQLYIRQIPRGHGNFNIELQDKKQLDGYTWNRHMGGIQDINTHLKLKTPIYTPLALKITEIKRVDLDKRPTWKHFSDYLKAELANPEFTKALEAFVGSYKYTVDLKNLHSTHQDLLDNMAYIKEHKPTMFACIETVLKDHGMLDTIKDIHANSKVGGLPQSYTIQAVIDKANQLGQFAGVTLTLPKLSGRVITPDTARKMRVCNLMRDNHEELYRNYPKSYPKILEEILSRS